MLRELIRDTPFRRRPLLEVVIIENSGCALDRKWLLPCSDAHFRIGRN